VVGERVSEVTLEEAGDPVPVLGQERAVGAELVVEVLDRALVCERPQDAACDVPRQHLGADEDEHAQKEQRDEGEAHALE
jgi:hypothetical protein